MSTPVGWPVVGGEEGKRGDPGLARGVLGVDWVGEEPVA